MEEQRQRGHDAYAARDTSVHERAVDDEQRGERERECRRAQHLERLAEEPGPRCAPQNHCPEAHSREVRELKVTGAGEVPGGDGEVPVVEDREIATRVDDRDRHGPDDGKEGELREVLPRWHWRAAYN